jgi:hypothetical protein
MPWSAIITFALNIVGILLDRAKADTESKKKFIELIDILQSKNLVSANIKIDREGRIARLKGTTDEPS